MRTNMNQAAFTFWCLVVIILTIVVLRMCAWADTGARGGPVETSVLPRQWTR